MDPAYYNRIREFSSDCFDWKDLHGVCCMSILDQGMNHSVFAPIFNDASDLGFYVKSTRTGKSVPFVLMDRTYTSDGDSATWELESYPNRDVKLTIFND